jgi:hypothetical protein
MVCLQPLESGAVNQDYREIFTDPQLYEEKSANKHNLHLRYIFISFLGTRKSQIRPPGSRSGSKIYWTDLALDTDLSINKKIMKKNLDFYRYCSVTFYL